VRTHQVVVLSGATGCGKTTQVPQVRRGERRAGAGRGARDTVPAALRARRHAGARRVLSRTSAQFILDDAIVAGQGAGCNIVCTQPRRISAISVAERVAFERAERVGGTVGYQIRMESRRSARTQLSFCTTGVLLRQLATDPDLMK
jgi:HrpA-like RNA helicase